MQLSESGLTYVRPCTSRVALCAVFRALSAVCGVRGVCACGCLVWPFTSSVSFPFCSGRPLRVQQRVAGPRVHSSRGSVHALPHDQRLQRRTALLPGLRQADAGAQQVSGLLPVFLVQMSDCCVSCYSPPVLQLPRHWQIHEPVQQVGGRLPALQRGLAALCGRRRVRAAARQAEIRVRLPPLCSWPLP